MSGPVPKATSKLTVSKRGIVKTQQRTQGRLNQGHQRRHRIFKISIPIQTLPMSRITPLTGRDCRRAVQTLQAAKSLP
jgi:hypothetical protein